MTLIVKTECWNNGILSRRDSFGGMMGLGIVSRSFSEISRSGSPKIRDHWTDAICAVAVGLLLAINANGQTVDTDSISHEKVLIGPVQRSAFQDSSWFATNYTLYTPATELISKIDSLSSGDSVSIVFGSWCSDSHMWVPMFLGIAERTALARKIGFIAVPRSKGWREELTPGLNIEKVPTFIFYHGGKEIGRIVEEPEGDIGENIVEILGCSASLPQSGKPAEGMH